MPRYVLQLDVPYTSIVILMFYSFSLFLLLLFRLLRYHNRLLACTNSSCLSFVHECAVPTYRRKGKTDRGCVAILFHTTDLLTHSGSQVAHSAERTDVLIFLLTLCLSRTYASHQHVLIALHPFLFLSKIRPVTPRLVCMDPSGVNIVFGMENASLSVCVIFKIQKCSPVEIFCFFVRPCAILV